MKGRRTAWASLLVGALSLAAGCRGLAGHRPASIPTDASGEALSDTSGDARRSDGPSRDGLPDRSINDQSGINERSIGDHPLNDAWAPDTASVEQHPNFTRSTAETVVFSTHWDLTRCALDLRATIDFLQLLSANDSAKIFVEVGLQPPSDPGGWLVASPVFFQKTDPLALDLDDKLILQSQKGQGEDAYDVDPQGNIVPALGTSDNHGIWFDRDGKNLATKTCAGLPIPSRLSYCSGGVYPVVITFRAKGLSSGTMVATVNGLAQGFNTKGWKPKPDIVPAGKSFKGDMTKLQLFVRLLTPQTLDGSITVRSIRVTGCKAVP